MENSGILMEKWSQGFGLHVNGVVFGDGRVVLCDCVKLKREGRTHTMVTPLGESTLASVLQYDDDPWVPLTEMDRQEPAGMDITLTCGEGAMGNEGYVAVMERSTQRLKWLAFFTCSNPFTSVQFKDGTAIAENTYEQEWSFRIDSPQEITIQG